MRKANDLVKGIYSPNGQWTTNVLSIQQTFLNYFQNLYSRENPLTPNQFNWNYSLSHHLDPDRLAGLASPITQSETDEAIKKY